MNGQPAISGWRIFWAAAAFLTMIAGALVLRVFDPETAGFYPVCAFHRLTGLQCPGCGTLRALHQLTRGNIAAAWRFNALIVTLLPMGLWLGLREAARWTLGWRWPGIIARPIVGWLVLVATVGFGIARNLR
jgi:hypothetical protein